MEWDDGDDDEDEVWPLGAPLPPDDRLWRHPAEVGAATRITSDTTVSTPWHKTAAVAGLSALASGALVAGLFLTLSGTATTPGEGQDRPEALQVVSRDPLYPVPQAVAADEWPILVSQTASPGVAEVRVDRDGELVTGSAFLFRPDGQLLTSYDLVDGTDEVEVIFGDGPARTGTVLGADQRSGVALVAVDEVDLPPVVRLALLKQPPRLGNFTLVLDASEDLSSIPIARISALETEVAVPDDPNLYGLIQLDAPLPPTATGAPVLDDAGDAIGVAIGTGPDGGTAVVPIGYARAVVDSLDRYDGQARHTWLGITGRDLGTGAAAALGLSGGVEVAAVIEGSPAAEVGLEVGDVIVALDDRQLVSMSDLILELREHSVDAAAEISYVRGTDPRTSVVTLRAQPTRS